MSALTVQVLRLSVSLGSVTAVNLRSSVCGAQGSLARSLSRVSGLEKLHSRVSQNPVFSYYSGGERHGLGLNP